MDEPPLLLYDNGCGVCHWLVRFVLRNDPARRFMFAPLDSRAGRERMVRCGVDPAVDTVVVIADERGLVRSDAVLRILGELGWPWRLLVAGAVVPRSWRDWVYDTFARRRQRISRRFRLTCQLPAEGEEGRFLR
ncbi:MAG: DCC1-like thiol-disulfide oxidoreductase family protein [Gemmatimonadota bacterium]